MKMKDRNSQLKNALGSLTPKRVVSDVVNIPTEDTKNRQGHAAYSLDDEIKLVNMLNTLKLQPQFYRTETGIMKDLRDVIERLSKTNPYFVAQAIVWSRCCGEGMRSINHLAASLVSPFIAGQEWAKRFYGPWNKKTSSGGCIFRVDDMSEIKDAYASLGNSKLSNAMKKGFAKTIESLDTYQLGKYKKTIIDISNLCHPKSSKSNAMIGDLKTLDALMKGVTVTVDTWETAQSEAGQEVAKAVREGKISKVEAEKVLSEAKADNWESLLKDGKLPIIAALRNIRNIMRNPRREMIDLWCSLINDTTKIKNALVLPIYFDLAYEIVMDEFQNADYSPKVQQALLDGYEASLPNMKNAFPGRTCIMIDCSGSMGGYEICDGKTGSNYNYWSRSRRNTKTCAYKAGLIAATFVKATGADVIRFGGSASRCKYNKNTNIFALAKQLGTADQGSTNPAAAFNLIAREKSQYDRIIFISDNEVNGRITSETYKTYLRVSGCSPYIYAIDLAAYGTTPLKNDGKVSYYRGYGASMYEDIKSHEFNALSVLDKIKAIVI